MGTNYYHVTGSSRCDHCGRGGEIDKKHIGKSSVGWAFMLHVYPEEKIYNLEDWIDRIKLLGGKIYNEYDDEITLNCLYQIITDRSGMNKTLQRMPAHPSNLGPGGPTWDKVIGEFS